MSDDRKRIGAELDPDAPATPEEEAESSRLRDALEGVGDADPIAEALKAAWAPEPIDADEHRAIVDDVPTAEELALAAELRDALDRQPVVTLLRSAWAPAALGENEHRAIVAKAIAALPAKAKKTSVVLRLVVGGGATTLALAAGVVLWITTQEPAEAPLARSRSTAPLFDEPFSGTQASARIDKIIGARSSDYRDNRFAKWGVR